MGKIKDTIEFEAYNLKLAFSQGIRKTSTWMIIIAIISLLAAIQKIYLLVVFLIVIEVILQSKKNYDDGLVRDYLRKKYIITPSSTISTT